MTYQDDSRVSGIDVVWGNNLTVQHTSNADATNMTVTVNGDSTTYGLDTLVGSTMIDTSFNRFVSASVSVEDAEVN